MKNMSSFNWSLLITSVITIIGWVFGSYLNSKRDRENKLRDIKLTYLIDAYRKMAYSSQRTTNYEHFKFDMESAISDIQLFGSKEQIELLNKAIVDLNKHKIGLDADLILNNLRDELRKEINLELINSNVQWVRFNEAGLDSINNEIKKLKQQ